jgi:hypothetical protein
LMKALSMAAMWSLSRASAALRWGGTATASSRSCRRCRIWGEGRWQGWWSMRA